MTSLICAGCGCEGEAPKIRYHAEANPVPTIKPVFGYHVDQPARPVLLCTKCRDRWMRRTVFKPGRAR